MKSRKDFIEKKINILLDRLDYDNAAKMQIAKRYLSIWFRNTSFRFDPVNLNESTFKYKHGVITWMHRENYLRIHDKRQNGYKGTLVVLPNQCQWFWNFLLNKK